LDSLFSLSKYYPAIFYLVKTERKWVPRAKRQLARDKLIL
jgi:hypothetical protein